MVLGDLIVRISDNTNNFIILYKNYKKQNNNNYLSNYHF